jgi:ATP-dependent helicase Lhr and Lhr-like helicase
VHEVPFHSLVADWFRETFAAPTSIQTDGWRHIAAGTDTLIAAPTGSGKTLAAFLWTLNDLVERGLAGRLEDRIHAVYVSPLKALGNDIQKNLQIPLAGIRAAAAARGTPLPEIRVAVRSGDTPAHERALQLKRPPHILITTPESLYILLTAEKSRALLREASTVIIDEIHAVAADKRGSHLALSVERLDALTGGRLQRIGLSATQKPIDEVARLLVGAGRCNPDGAPRCAIVDAGHRRALDLRVETPDQELGAITSHELRAEIYARLAALVTAHRTTIVFVNTRRLVERVAHALGELLGADRVAAHHGSMSRELRLAAESGLKSGAVPVIVATASLELGIDVGHVDLVCHLGAPRSLASLLQRVGRSGHSLGALPKGILFPLTRDELVQCAAAVRAVEAGELDRLTVPENPLDILAQQAVAITASEGEIEIEGLWELVRRAYPFRHLARRDFDAVIDMLADGVSTRRGRRSAHLHADRVHGRLRPRRGARLAAITGGGAIPDMADYDVVEDATNAVLGKVNEDFAIESLAGDIFQLGNRAWRIRRVEAGRVRVVDAAGAPPTMPFWLGEAPARTPELSAAIADLRREVAARVADPAEAADWLVTTARVDRGGAEQLTRYVSETLAVLGAVPTLDTIIAERFFDEGGGMQLVLHAPFGGRVNRAFGLALRKRFCVTFDFELQAAATDDGIIVSLGEQHSFALESVFGMVRSRSFFDDLVQAALVAPMFGNRWRWNVTRALALLRFSGGRKVPMPLQRMRAEDLLAAVFPAQLACGDNQVGPIEPPDHPLVNETLANCLHEAMDSDGLRDVLEGIESGAIRTVAVETAAPSPMSHELLNANPYAFLDDAPLEERRARAVSLRRTDPDLAAGIGALDPEAIAEVRRQAWPDARDADEVHDALLTLGLLPAAEAGPWSAWLEELVSSSRCAQLVRSLGPHPDPPPSPEMATGEGTHSVPLPREHFCERGRAREGADAQPSDAHATTAYAAAERLALARLVLPDASIDPPILPLALGGRDRVDNAQAAVLSIVRGWMDSIGPTSAAQLAARLGLTESAVDGALHQLEADGCVLRGRFTADAEGAVEWCERGLLSRIHRLTLGRLRREIEAVAPADFVRFLFAWQHVQPGSQLHGRDGVRHVIAQLQGLELPGPAWERDVLPARVAEYDPADLEQLCLAGEVAWGRLAVASAVDAEESAPAPRRRPMPTRAAPLAFVLRADLAELLAPAPDEAQMLAERSPAARAVLDYLQQRGASFLADVARGLGRLPTEVEDALWELVASGLVTGDGIAGLRTLLLPERERRPRRAKHLRALPGGAARRLMPVGRWALLRDQTPPAVHGELAAERWAHRLLLRWGVLFRELCARERGLPSWRMLLQALRRLEARGEIRGGRFVDGFIGEQFALPEAVDALRSVRRRARSGDIVLVAAADPLNLVGILTDAPRVSPFSGQVIAYRDGVPVEIGELGTVRSRLQTAQR